MRHVKATVAGRTYQIPEAWMMGYLQANPTATPQDAALRWHEQELISEAFNVTQPR